MATPMKLIKEVNKKLGAGTLTVASDPDFRVTRLPSGILSLDYLLHGGFPRGRHIELYGLSGVAKTSVCLYTIASAQRAGEMAAFFDTEDTFDPDYAAHLGVNLDELTVHRQRHGNQVVDVVETLLRSREYGIIVLDSIAALLPLQELEANMEQGSMGMEQAKLMSKALRKLTTANHKTTLLYINQLRENVGGSLFGPKYRTSGGHAMSFYATTRLELVRTENVRRKTRVIDPDKGHQDKEIARGHRVLVRVAKNKSGGAKVGDTGTFVFDYESASIDEIEDLIYVGLSMGIIKQSGKTWKVGKREFTGKARAKKYIAQPEIEFKLRKRIETTMVERLGGAQGTQSQDPEARKKKGRRGRGKSATG